MEFDLLDTAELVDLIQDNEPVPQFWLDLAFPTSYNSTSEKIVFEELPGNDRRLAPFVMPHVQGQPMMTAGATYKAFAPAYVKPKHALSPNRTLKRRPGERILGSLTPQQRADAITNDVLREHDEMIDRRLEWMACEAIRNGSVVISGENYPTVTVDFGRRSDHNVTLAGGAQWDELTADIFGNLTTWGTRLRVNGSTRMRRLIMGTAASAAFFSNEKVQAMFETRRGSTVSMETYRVNDTVATLHGVIPSGEAAGVELWTYADTWVDNDGVEQQFLPANEVIALGDVRGVRAFGAIQDADAGFAAVEKFPKMWKNPDPSVIYLMTQSAPLMVPVRPNGSLRAVVV